jgi:N-methylhydantoinase A/oxoprolinase/acetone carboxylase beta subunit
MRVAVDTGGTFTDLVADDGRVVKLPSTPTDPARAVADAIVGVAPPGGCPAVLAHGTTVATNALLEGRLARVALVVNVGFADQIEIARQARPSLYDQHVDRPPALVARADRHEVAGRLGPDGRVLEPFDGVVPAIDPAVDAVAVCLLHADLAPEAERAVAAEIASRGFDVTVSSDVSPELREYERMVTTVVNAGLRPVCRPYLRALLPLATQVGVMTSAGGLVPLGVATEQPAALLLSGPAGGVIAAAAIASDCGLPGAVAFDMGGTSTDVCLVRDGVPEPTPTRVVAGYPIRLPGLAVHTIGAGGGSIARIDAGGALVVGPESAGARPGPASYGWGGTAPTVTDADLVLGRIPADAPLPGLGALDVGAARDALSRAHVDAAGVVAVVDAAMERAVRAVTVALGVDPRELALVAFGGAGPLHACAIAGALGMRAVVVPPRAGVFSAVGLLGAPASRELTRSWPTPADHRGLDDARADLARDVLAFLTADGSSSAGTRVDTALDCRFAGQRHELTVAEVDAFAAAHERHNGFTRPGVPIEVVAIRARATRPSPIAMTDLPPVARRRVDGPAVVAEEDCTVWIPDGWRAMPHPTGAWIITERG